MDTNFLTSWNDREPTRSTWEPMSTFLPNTSSTFLEYLSANNLEVEILEKFETSTAMVVSQKVQGTAIGPTPNERYAVRKPVMDVILFRLKSDTPTVDAFADSDLHVLPRWWGPGSTVPDAFEEH